MMDVVKFGDAIEHECLMESAGHECMCPLANEAQKLNASSEMPTGSPYRSPAPSPKNEPPKPPKKRFFVIAFLLLSLLSAISLLVYLAIHGNTVSILSGFVAFFVWRYIVLHTRLFDQR